MSGSRVVTAVRVRPYSSAEIASGSLSVVSFDTASRGIGISHPSVVASSANKGSFDSSPAPDRVFNYDYTFWSASKNDSYFSNQESVFSQIGRPIIDNCLQGMNCSLFAYGNINYRFISQLNILRPDW